MGIENTITAGHSQSYRAAIDGHYELIIYLLSTQNSCRQPQAITLALSH